MTEQIKQAFTSRFGAEPLLVRSPGRINLIGEHTDYNNGFVLPAAIDKAIYFATGLRSDDEIHLYALDLDESYSGNINDIKKSGLDWPDYILGGLEQLQKRGYPLKGFNGVIGGDVPLGAGLSSSAAVECASLFAFNEMWGLGIDRMDIVKMAQASENQFVGVMCGIMDQFASAFGKKDQVIKLDCRSLAYDYVPFVLDGIKVVLLDTAVKHSLASSEYNLRRQECEAGVDLIQKKYPQVASLRDATMEMVEEMVAPADETVYRRCRYVVGEIQRLQDACIDLDKGDIEAFGKKMIQTHDGLSKDYEVSCKELDFLVDHVRTNPDVLGARMMGGGFGGCTINLVKEAALSGLIEDITAAYKQANNLELKHYVVAISDGTGLVAG
jgi:galactokinase